MSPQMLTVFNRQIARTLPLLNAVAVLSAVLLALATHSTVAFAEPDSSDENIPSVLEVFDTAVEEYNNAKGRLDASIQKQADLETEIANSETLLVELTKQAGTVANMAYRGSRTTSVDALLTSDSPETFLDGLTMVKYVTSRDDRILGELKTAQATYADQKQALADEVTNEQEQLTAMEEQKAAAEDALDIAGGGQLSAGFVPGEATATQAPRNSDGSWASESATIDDPTSGGKITARTLHAYEQARAAGYTRYTHCWRTDDHGEHPKGRACDFSSAETTFLTTKATGDDKTYGDKLTGWLIANTGRLGIKYVIWYNQIWFPSSGWRTYTAGDGTASGDHYNHIHLSLQ